MGSRPEGIFETVFFIGVQFVFLGLLGAIFALILPFITSEHHLFKGALYGATGWFIFFSLPYLLQLPDLVEVPLSTSVSNVISAALWGIAMAFILNRLDNKELHQR